MPKRKREDGYEKLLKKCKKLEKKLRRRCRSRSQSSSQSETAVNPDRWEPQEHEHAVFNEACEVTEILDGRATPQLQNHAPPDTDRTGEPPAESALEFTEAVTATTVDSAMVGPSSEPATTLNSTILEILGNDPTILSKYGTEIHKDLAVRLEHFATQGLQKDIRKELIDKYLLPSNCTLINAPALNAEIKAAVSEMVAKRDKNIELRQKQIATSISCLSQAINKLFSCQDTDAELIKMLMDAERLLCDSQHHDSIIRRNYILSSLKKEMKDQLQNTKPDTLLFGQNLTETLKAARAINKSGAELKVSAPRPQQTASKRLPGVVNTSNNLNWKGPFHHPPRKQPNHPKTKDPPVSKNQQTSSSRRYQQQPVRGRR